MLHKKYFIILILTLLIILFFISSQRQFLVFDSIENLFISYTLTYGYVNSYNPRSVIYPLLLSPLILLLRVFGIIKGLFFVTLMRIIPISFSLLSVYTLYLIGKKWYNASVGILASIFYGFSWLQLRFGSTFLTEVPSLFFLLLSLFFFFRRKTKINLFFSGVLLALSFYTRYWIIIYILPFFFFLILFYRKSLPPFILGFLFFFFVGSFSNYFFYGKLFKSEMYSLQLGYIENLSNFIAYSPINVQNSSLPTELKLILSEFGYILLTISQLPNLLSWPGLFFFMYFLVLLLKGKTKAIPIFFIWLFALFVILAYPVKLDRFFYLALPFFCLFSAEGMNKLASRFGSGKKFFIVSMVSIFILTNLAQFGGYSGIYEVQDAYLSGMKFLQTINNSTFRLGTVDVYFIPYFLPKNIPFYLSDVKCDHILFENNLSVHTIKFSPLTDCINELGNFQDKKCLNIAVTPCNEANLNFEGKWYVQFDGNRNWYWLMDGNSDRLIVYNSSEICLCFKSFIQPAEVIYFVDGRQIKINIQNKFSVLINSMKDQFDDFYLNYLSFEQINKKDFVNHWLKTSDYILIDEGLKEQLNEVLKLHQFSLIRKFNNLLLFQKLK